MPAELGHHVHELEVQLMMKAVMASVPQDPTVIATSMLSQYREKLQNDLCNILSTETPIIVWCEVWNGTLLKAKIEQYDGELEVNSDVTEFSMANSIKAMNLPMADSPPGRLRSRRITTALKSGWLLFAPEFENIPPTLNTVFVGPSFLGSWPIDASEAAHASKSSQLRSVTFTPTLRVAASARQQRADRHLNNILLVSYGGSDLPGTRQEIEDIQSVYASGLTILDGAKVDKAEVLSALSEPYDVIHFCGHGEFNYLDPLKSRIYFDVNRGENGLVSASDIQRCGTIGRDPIVVLSACTSALVLPNGSNNYLGLAGALLRTGATSIVGARWPISDKTAACFAKQFHMCLAGSGSVAKSVAFAKSQLRNTRVDEWSAYMHIGA